jgi:hypothetical protein
MIRGLPLLIMVICGSVYATESVRVITADDWARPRSGESLVGMPALEQTVGEFLSKDAGDGQRILIRHPRGEEGVLWAEELRGWLVSLGIASDHIAVSPESTRVDALELAVTDKEN